MRSPLTNDETNAVADPVEPVQASNAAALVTGHSALDQDLAATIDRLEQLAGDRRLVESMHEELRQLRADQLQREVLLPLFRGLIRFADRCRDEVEHLRRQRVTANSSGRHGRLTNPRELIQARASDIIEIESLLAVHGVEPYRHLERLFDPRLQRCIARVPAPNESFEQHIAERLRPGYRRGDLIVRPEYVAVFVVTPPDPITVQALISS